MKIKTNFVLLLQYNQAWYHSKWEAEISLKAEKFEKQYKVSENGYIEVIVNVSSLENSTNRGSDILLMKKLQTYYTKLPAPSPSDVIKNKNSDWIRELHRVIWLDKNAVKWYRITSLIRFFTGFITRIRCHIT